MYVVTTYPCCVTAVHLTKNMSVHLDSPTCFNTSITKFLKIDIKLSHIFQNMSI